jgi:hypothetical protein
MPELDPSHNKLLAALSVAACTRLGDDTAVIDADGQLQTCRLVRVGDDIALVDIPADDRSPRCINCYSVDVERFDAIDGHKFKLDPAGLIYAQRHDLHLALVRDVPEQWVNAASLTLLSALRRWAPHSIDWSAMGDIALTLDAFEAHMDAKTARRH